MNVKIDHEAPRRRVESRGATYSLGDWCRLNNIKPTIAKIVMTNILRLDVIESETLKREIKKYEKSIKHEHA